jgi:hypothetical protein
LPDLEQGPRRADRVPHGVHAFISWWIGRRWGM